MRQKQQLFECVVLGHLNTGTDENPKWKTEVVIDGRLLATNHDEATFKVTKMIPDDDVEKYGLGELQILIRLFS